MALGSVASGLSMPSAADIFKKMDKNGDGVLDVKEMGLKDSEAQRGTRRGANISAAFEAMDGDGDGLVTQEEFATFYSSIKDVSKSSAGLSLADHLKGGEDLGFSSSKDSASSLLAMLQAKQQQAKQSGETVDMQEVYDMIEKLRSSLSAGALMDVEA